MAEIVVVDARQPDDQLIARAAARLLAGGLVAFPTETVYGLGVHALDRAAVRRLFEAKGRPPADPLIVHIASIDDLTSLVRSVPAVVWALAYRFWPGPLTLVLPRATVVPDEVTAGLDTVAVRIPAHPVAHALISAAGVPVAAPSANLFSRPSPTSAAHVLHDLGDRIDMIVDGGATDVGVESTVLDVTAAVPTVLRPGAVTLAMLGEIVPGVHMRTAAAIGDQAPLPSPGMLATHYAPRTPLTLLTGDAAIDGDALVEAVRQSVAAGLRTGVLAWTGDEARLRAAGAVTASLGDEHDLTTTAARLYAAIREVDALGLDRLYARDVAFGDGLGPAIHDRLTRASAQIVTRGNPKS